MARKERSYNVVSDPTEDIIADDIKVIELNECRFEKKIPRLKTKNITTCNLVPKLSAHLKHKKLFEIDLTLIFANENISSEKMFSMLEKETSKIKITKLQWPTNDSIFEKIRISEFKNAGSRILKNLEIFLIHQPKKNINDNEKMTLMKQFHIDPIFGGHVGKKKLYSKLRAQYFWKHMTRDIAKFVRNCNKCLVNKVKQASKEEMVLTPTYHHQTLGSIERNHRFF